jgi:hypothetical protein
LGVVDGEAAVADELDELDAVDGEALEAALLAVPVAVAVPVAAVAVVVVAWAVVDR